MDFSLFEQLPFVVCLHILFAVVAIILGPVALYMPHYKMRSLHRVCGYVWMVSMGVVALSSFFIHSFAVIGPFSPIHLLAILVLWSIARSLYAVSQRDILLHKQIMTSMYWNGVALASLFNFLPERFVNKFLFGQAEDLGYVVIALGGAALLTRYVLVRGKSDART